MKFNKIDRILWHREKTFNHFINDIPCTYSMCVNLDITGFLSTLKEHHLKLFPSILYGISCIVNRHSEFRMAFNDDNELGYYDVSYPSYSVFHQETESFSNIWTEHKDDFQLFYSKYIEDIFNYANPKEESFQKLDVPNLFYVSCIPWVSFTGFNLNLQKGYNYLPPIFTVGKFYEESNKILLPLALQVNHAVCDGFHVGRFVNELQDWVNNFILCEKYTEL